MGSATEMTPFLHPAEDPPSSSTREVAGTAPATGSSPPATSPLSAGDASASTPKKRAPDRRCNQCWNKAKFRCGLCKTAYYCTKECQAKNWTVHQLDCKPYGMQSYSSKPLYPPPASSPLLRRILSLPLKLILVLLAAIIFCVYFVIGILILPCRPRFLGRMFMNDSNVSVKENEEYVREIKETIIRDIERGKAAGGLPPKPHSRVHGLVECILRINDDLPQFMQVSSLLQAGKSFRVLGRLSQGFGLVRDTGKFSQGFALKILMGEEGEMNLITLSPAGLSPFASTFNFRVMATMYSSALYPPNWPFFLRMRNYLHNVDQYQRNIGLFGLKYGTMAHAFGEKKSCKFYLIPQQTHDLTQVRLRELGTTFYSKGIDLFLNTQGKTAIFDFCIQLQPRGGFYDEEDGSLYWDPTILPIVKIGTLSIPPQDITTQERKRWAHAIDFPPLDGPRNIQLLGKMAHARAEVYEAAAEKRREFLNIEPVDAHHFPFDHVI